MASTYWGSMKSKFAIGDRVCAVVGPKRDYVISPPDMKMLGWRGTITDGPILDNRSAAWPVVRWNVKWDIGGNNCVDQDWLAPIYDGDQKISWDECAWKPKFDILILDEVMA